MGKIEIVSIKKIEDDAKRNITFQKRKRGFLKKAIELSVLCDQQMLILIYDNQVQQLIAPIFKVGNLRDCNVVLHQNINSKRETCPGLPAVYLVEPTEANMKLIAGDC